MTNNEEFEKCLSAYAAAHVIGSTTLIRKIALHFYDARQPEIDALKANIATITGASARLEALVDRNEELEAEVEKLRADAERYRWLRSQHWNEADIAVVCHPKTSVKLGFDCPSLERLDEYIDAAIKEMK